MNIQASISFSYYKHDRLNNSINTNIDFERFCEVILSKCMKYIKGNILELASRPLVADCITAH